MKKSIQHGRHIVFYACLLPVIVVAAESDRGRTGSPYTVDNCRVSILLKSSVAGERLAVVDEVLVKPGDEVRKGQLLVKTRDRSARTALAAAAAEAENDVEYRFAQKAGELARSEYEKALELNSEIPGAHSQRDLQHLRLAAERALLQMEQAQFHQHLAELRRSQAEAALLEHQVVAPFDGTVTELHVQPGEAVPAGGAVVQLEDQSRMQVSGVVPLEDVWRLHRGGSVLAHVDVGRADTKPVTYPGRLTRVDSRVEELTRRVRFWAEVENTDGELRDGLTATVRFDTPPTRSAGAVR